VSPARVAIGSDHGGFLLKRSLLWRLAEDRIAALDCGCFSPEPVDYPEFALAVARRVLGGEAEAGLMIDAAGIGSTMVLNRVPGIRAALCHDVFTARNSRAHNDANVLVLGARVVSPGEAHRLLRLWLATAYEGGRHERRVGRLRALDAERAGSSG
jgi:ribose 5-phosphate isomerase B